MTAAAPRQDSAAQPADALQYRVLLDARPVGHVTSRRRTWAEGGVPRLAMRSEIALRASGMWSDYALDSREEIVLDPQGVLRYEGTQVEDGERTTARGERRGTRFELHVDGGRPRELAIEMAVIDATSEDAASRFLQGGRARAVLRVLDLDRFEMDEVEFRLLPPQSVAVASATRPVAVVAFEYRTRRSGGTAWYVPHAGGHVLVQESVLEDGDRHDVKLINWEKTTWNHAT